MVFDECLQLFFFINYVTLGKLYNLSEIPFLVYKIRIIGL